MSILSYKPKEFGDGMADWLFGFLFVLFPLSIFGPLGFFINAGLYLAGLFILLFMVVF